MQNYFETLDRPLVAADFDYFRLPPEKWELLLTRLSQLGATTLTLSIPWGFHEFKPGSIDFNGTTHPRRNLMRVLALCTAFDFYCILKPGPYHRRGLLAQGLPFWLKNKPDFDAALPPSVESWYKALSKRLVAHQWQTGPIIAIQINQKDGDLPPFTLNKQLTKVKWRIWLRKHYQGIETLNAAYSATYQTVNDVKFPLTWANRETPVEKDAAQFLEKVQHDTLIQYTQILVDAGWQIPIYPPLKEIHADFPSVQTYSFLDDKPLSALNGSNSLLSLQHPIQVDPDPVDVGQGPIWANEAPIQTNGSLQPNFWQVRQAVWPHLLPQSELQAKTVQASFEASHIVTSSGDTPLKIEVGRGVKPTIYRLRLNGELLLDSSFKTRAGRVSGPYLAADEQGQTDLMLILHDPSAPLTDFPLTYLRRLLIAQAQTLSRGAILGRTIEKMLTVAKSAPAASSAKSPTRTLNTLEEARRGLSDADAVLRKAMASISGLEDGFATILGKTDPDVSPAQSYPAPVPLDLGVFKGQNRRFLRKVGATCAEIAPNLAEAAVIVQTTLTPPNDLTVEIYQQAHATAVAAAQAGRDPLLEIIAKLRLEIALERFPPLAWRIHNQVQEMAETLRWGALRR